MPRQALRAIRRAIGLPPWPPGGLVLLYHRIADLAADPQCLAVSPGNFSAHLDVVRTHGVFMTLEDMVNAAHDGRLPPRAVAITFDDGYADNLDCAAPLLAGAHAPATVFVSTGTLECGREFWWDELERLILQPGMLPALIRLPVGDRVAEWDLAGATHWTAADSARYSSWTVADAEAPTPRHRLYCDLCSQLQSVTGHARDRTLHELAALGGQTRQARPTHRPLAAGEVAALAQPGHITIGSHTDSHPSLAHLAPEEQRSEIARGRRRLESLVGAPVTTFAYPFGGSRDFSGQTAAIVRQEGIGIACSTSPGSVHQTTNRYGIPRLLVRNWPRTEFMQRWSAWTGMN